MMHDAAPRGIPAFHRLSPSFFRFLETKPKLPNRKKAEKKCFTAFTLQTQKNKNNVNYTLPLPMPQTNKIKK